GSDQVDENFAGVTIEIVSVDASRFLPRAPVRFANGKAGDELKSLPVKGRHHAGLEVGALGELPGLEQGLRAAQQSGARFERNPDGELAGNLAIAAGERHLGKLANDDGVPGSRL